MDFGSIFLILALAVAVAVFVSRPFFEPEPAAERVSQQAVRPQDQQRSALLAERDRLVIAMRELEFDHTLGKIPEEDYPAQRDSLLTAGAEVLKQLEELPAEPGAGRGSPPAQPAELLRNGMPAEPVDELEEMILAHRRARQEKAAGFCPSCGKPLRKSDKFCPRCGAAL
jgi:hypothetical protein